MDFDLYRKLLDKHVAGKSITKVILLGGEPTLHPDISQFIEEAHKRELLVTVYTNGYNLKAIPDIEGVTVRIGVLGYKSSEKPLAEIKAPSYPVAIVYMLRRDNLCELDNTIKDAEERFKCRYFMLSSIRDIETTKSFFIDTDKTLPNEDYRKAVIKFIGRYRGRLPIHISTRGIFPGSKHNWCRFLNFFPDGSCTICPFDISLGTKDDPENFRRKCGKAKECLLQKWVYQVGF